MWIAHNGMGWWMVFGGILSILFWVAIIVLVIWGINKLVQRERSGKGLFESRSALDIARERYARGEITREEYDQIKKDLS